MSEMKRLRAENLRLRAAISWIEPPFVDGSTSHEELKKRVQFCVEDAARVHPNNGAEQ